MTRLLLAIAAAFLFAGLADARQEKKPTEEEKKAEKLEKDIVALHKSITTLVKNGGKTTSLPKIRETILKFADTYREKGTRTLKSKDGSIFIVLGSAMVKDKDGEAVTAEDEKAQLVIAVGGEGGSDIVYEQGQQMGTPDYTHAGGKAVAKCKEGLAIAIGGRGGRGLGVLEETKGTVTKQGASTCGGPGGDGECESTLGSIGLGGLGGELDPTSLKAWRQEVSYSDSVDCRKPRPTAGTPGEGSGARSLDSVARWLKEKENKE